MERRYAGQVLRDGGGWAHTPQRRQNASGSEGACLPGQRGGRIGAGVFGAGMDRRATAGLARALQAKLRRGVGRAAQEYAFAFWQVRLGIRQLSGSAGAEEYAC